MYKHSIDDGQRDDIDININQRNRFRKPATHSRISSITTLRLSGGFSCKSSMRRLVLIIFGKKSQECNMARMFRGK